MRQSRERISTDQVRDRNAQRPAPFGKTTMLAPTARKAGRQIYSNVRLCRSLAQRGSNDPGVVKKLLSFGDITVFGTTQKNTWSNTSLQLAPIRTVWNKVTALFRLALQLVCSWWHRSFRA